MESIHNIFMVIAEWIDIIGISIMIYGFVRTLWRLLKVEITKPAFSLKVVDIQSVRCEIGIYILLALDFLIASDIVHTILDITDRQLIALSIMIVIRTGIGYFLSKEITELEKQSKE